MKRLSIVLFFIAFIISCSDKQTLTFENLELNSGDCNTCAQIEVTIPEANNNSDIATKINTVLTQKVIDIIDFSEENVSQSIPEAVKDFKAAFKELANDFPESPIWEATVDGSITYKKENIVCIQLDSYMFTGGAHGYSATHFIIINTKTGDELNHLDIFKNIDSFTQLVEKRFRKQENIALIENINSTGFLFENDQFYLPENIGFSNDEIILIYNQYEIASYADGQKTIKLPLSDIKSILKKK